MSSLLFPQQYTSRLTGMVCEMGSKWPYNCFFAESNYQDLLKIKACSIHFTFSSSVSVESKWSDHTVVKLGRILVIFHHACSTGIEALTPVFENSATEPNSDLLRRKNIFNILTFDLSDKIKR